MTAKAVESSFVPKIKRNITLPLIKPSLDVPVFVKITGAIFVGKKIENASDAKTKAMEPAHLFNCINLESGEMAQMIAPAVLQSIFTEEFPDDSYVGCGFSITKHPKGSGKAYHTFSVAELEL